MDQCEDDSDGVDLSPSDDDSPEHTEGDGGGEGGGGGGGGAVPQQHTTNVLPVMRRRGRGAGK